MTEEIIYGSHETAQASICGSVIDLGPLLLGSKTHLNSWLSFHPGHATLELFPTNDLVPMAGN